MSKLGLQGGTGPGVGVKTDTTLSKLEHIGAYSWIGNSGKEDAGETRNHLSIKTVHSS